MPPFTHGYNGLSLWEPAVRCDVTNFTPKSYSTILIEIDKTPDCDIDFYPLTYPRNSKCYIATCNTTGLWEHYDLLVEQACFLYLAPYCAICNGFNREDFQNDDSCDEAAPGGASFVALLDFRPDQQEEERAPVGKCTTLQIYDPIMVSDMLMFFCFFFLFWVFFFWGGGVFFIKRVGKKEIKCEARRAFYLHFAISLIKSKSTYVRFYLSHDIKIT